MINFNQFLEHKRNDFVVKECAQLMVEMDVDPHRYIYECLKEIDPVLAEGWWDGVKSFGKSLFNAGKAFVGDTARGAAAGYRQAKDAVSGPVAKFDAVSRALEDLVNVLENDPQERFKGFMSSTGEGTVGQYLAKVLQNLQRDKDAIPKLYDTNITQKYGSRADVDAARNANNQQNQQPGQQNQQPGQQNQSAMDVSKMSDPRYKAPNALPPVRSYEQRQKDKQGRF
jgi:hypothetical protein